MAKSADAFRTISEAAEEVGAPQHVLRFWETKFTYVKPMKRGGGRRYYRPEDIELVERIERLVNREGYTLKGAKAALRGASDQQAVPQEAAAPETPPAADLLRQLEAIRNDLKAALAA